MKSVRNKKAQKDNSYGLSRGRGLEGGFGGFSSGVSRTIGSGSLIIDESSRPRVTASHTALAPGPLNHTVSMKDKL